jgi:hypothetical protein
MVAEVQKLCIMMAVKKQPAVLRLCEQAVNLWWSLTTKTHVVMLVWAAVLTYLQVAGNELHSFAVDCSFRYFEQHWCGLAYQYGRIHQLLQHCQLDCTFAEHCCGC